MESAARVTSKGQVTLPKAVRDALGIDTGDAIVFRIDGERAVLARTTPLLDLGGTVSVPVAKRGADWQQVRRATRSARGSGR